MTAARVEIGIDCADPAVLVRFWALALGYQPDPHDSRAVSDPTGNGPGVWFQQVSETKVVKNRVHLDVWLGDEAAVEVRRDALVAAGGTAVKRFYDFWLMNDPEGNEFCLCWPVAAQSTGNA